MRRLPTIWSLSPLVAIVTACAHKPPPDYAPDPGLLQHVRDIEITVTGPRPDIYTVPTRDVFGPELPPELAALLEEARR